MKIAVTGSSGLIGSALVPELVGAGHEILRFVRHGSLRRTGTALWDPTLGMIDASALEGLDAVIHLAGENIGAGRWSAAKKARIYASRVDGTRLLATAIAGLQRPPRTLVAASAIGYYGHREDDIVDEDSAPGAGFLANVVREWEAATQSAAQRGVRVVNMRFGMVLSSEGGALASMIPAFRFMLGGPMGSGEQYISWVAIDDAVGSVLHVLQHNELSGPVNAVAPTPVTNAEFSATLGRVLSRPAALPLPAFAVKLLFGEMGEELLLSSTRVEPHRLKESGYAFRFPALEAALRHLLGRH